MKHHRFYIYNNNSIGGIFWQLIEKLFIKNVAQLDVAVQMTLTWAIANEEIVNETQT